MVPQLRRNDADVKWVADCVRRGTAVLVREAAHGVKWIMSATGFSKFAYDAAAMPRKLYGFDVVDFLGQGAGSHIYVVSNPATSQLYALKHVIRKEEKDIRFVEQLEAEYEVSSKFRHTGLRRS